MRVRTWYAPTARRKFPARIPSAFICIPLWLILFSLSAEPRWKIQFFYDRADANFDIEDLECPTAQHCVAAGVIDDKKGHQKGAVVVSGDGGQHWSQYEVKEQPLSLFFLNEGVGWMVTDRGLWSTVEGGRTWNKVESRKGILQAWFLDANHGYITGLQGLIQETTDGGKNWVKLEAGGTAPDATSLNYDIVAFQGMHGVIVGEPDASTPVPIRKSPSSGALERAASGTVSVMETLDGGKKWTYGTIPVEGDLAQLRISSKGFVVALLLYSDPKYPIGSALFMTPFGSKAGRMIFGERDRTATDVALLNNGSAVVVAIEPPGNSPQVPIPGKLKILRSGDLKVWREMEVDYRAVAQRAIIAAPDAQHMWVATDTGAILNLVE